MKTVRGDFWEYYQLEEDAYFCVTTNGIVSSGEAVMGRGIAFTVKQLFPWVPSVLGRMLRSTGNHVYNLGDRLISFPTKENWKDPSPIGLIERSCKELLHVMYLYGIPRVYLPKPGCENGGLYWHQVEPVLDEIFKDKEIICIYR